MARGGQNQPNNPAPVSGPGKLARRTDGGAGSATQPIRTAPGGDYGAKQASEQQQAAAPMAATASSPPAPSANGGAPAMPPNGAGGALPAAFGPTQRPGESPLAGMNPRGNAIAQDVDSFLRVLYSVFDHPAIGALLRKDF